MLNNVKLKESSAFLHKPYKTFSIGLQLAAVVTACVLVAMPANARVTREQAFELCIEQPVLQPENLRPAIQEQLNRPHSPSLDSLTVSQIIDLTEYFQADVCAHRLMLHPDVYDVLLAQKFSSRADWETAWIAVNSFCKDRLTGLCVQDEIDVADTIRDQAWLLK